MQKFSIYTKSNKFYWTAEIITYSTIFFCCGVMLFKQKVLNLEENLLDKVLLWFVLSTFMFGVILKFYNIGKYEPIRGKLLGYLIFEKDKLTVCDEIYPIENIKNIKIYNNDYSGKLVNTSQGNLGPALSNGTSNHIIIFFESGKSKRHQFELINSDDLQKVRKELINYYLKGKIEFDEITNVLGEKSRSEVAEFKLEIENERRHYH
ncbi:hypothetical protein [Flavobacterium turcicum]|uniref:SMODS-associating 2TM beta-strand rich effector domain-containing protein n=1 Tax=Flavobacterium turcicum TaxID=2764718 RepID=A0ABR7JJJ7_9FLAO|nr:hypothetical protein [Flavobacterium turcicum]MBC5864642.1 hypothetical protein [Flavobacterium turcicum]NHL03359.1 hypothetical protein [Flavobacterium turcicum]